MAGIKIEQDNALELFFITVILSSFFPLLAKAEQIITFLLYCYMTLVGVDTTFLLLSLFYP